MIIQSLLLALPLAPVWVILTGQTEPFSWLLGWLLGLAVIALVRPKIRVNPAKVPGQAIAMLHYSVRLAVDIVMSSVDVTVRVLNPRQPLRQGVIAVKTHSDDGIIGALSAHAITITPGSLVVDFDGRDRLYVHCLDVDSAAPRLDAEQLERLQLLERMLGHD